MIMRNIHIGVVDNVKQARFIAKIAKMSVIRTNESRQDRGAKRRGGTQHWRPTRRKKEAIVVGGLATDVAADSIHCELVAIVLSQWPSFGTMGVQVAMQLLHIVWHRGHSQTTKTTRT